MATLCCEKCVTTIGQMQVWALEDYLPEYAGFKLPIRCAVSVGSVVDAHFGHYYIKADTICTGTSVSESRKLLNDDLKSGNMT
jgi:hypothetical protein